MHNRYLIFEINFSIVLSDRVVKAPYAAADTISQGSAATNSSSFASSAFFQGDASFDPSVALAALQLGNTGGARRAFDTASLKSQDETIR